MVAGPRQSPTASPGQQAAPATSSSSSSLSQDSSDSSSTGKEWMDWFLSLRGHEFFCSIDKEYISDRFNLTGLYTAVPYFNQAMDLLLDQAAEDATVGDDMVEQVEFNAIHLYGLMHARFIVTHRGMTKMLEKYRKAVFGRCPRAYCHNQQVLPVGLTDQPGLHSVKLYCPRCEDIYHTRSTRFHSIDGAFFGTSFPHLFLQAYPNLIPVKTQERYIPRIYGFKLHVYSKTLVAPPAALPVTLPVENNSTAQVDTTVTQQTS